MWHRVYEYDHGNTTARYGHEAVEKLAVDPQRVANALVAVADKVDFTRLSITLGARTVRMANIRRERLTSHSRGLPSGSS
ncbi:hypothetical protein GCM10023190_04610 [Enteractinococcus fodinae]|uniref:Prolyl-tRNA editing enzyme YbaK/EbsC (Cys-tRNA(Pro) deacylase) n=1 Tax=Enteractinococcus fodinae TaxID=684663 RepID=A0ABU2B0D7_9MICC|nr:prolyl-tRNA editing enzyme YbaK/EbsC (Cys-tRNA(Pro) deacylase) [Enteractinococcus fodinae]